MKSGWPQWIGVGLAAVLLLAVGYGVATLRRQAQPAPIEIIAPQPTAAPATPLPVATATPGPLRVYVSGAVVSPAVYELPPDSLINDAVRAAGGFAADADRAAVNLAQPAADGMQIHVPAVGQVAATPPAVSLPVGDNSTPAVRMGGITTAGLININTATQTELEMLPGIGPSTATNIIAHREANGPFAAIEAIMDVPGIGEGKFEAIRDLITVGP
jgi:competence protein ComEA